MTSPQSDETAWPQRRASERDAAGISAARARQAILNGLNVGDDKLVRAASLAYGVLIDRAEALAHSEADVPQERQGTPLDELARRRGRSAS